MIPVMNYEQVHYIVYNWKDYVTDPSKTYEYKAVLFSQVTSFLSCKLRQLGIKVEIGALVDGTGLMTIESTVGYNLIFFKLRNYGFKPVAGNMFVFERRFKELGVMLIYAINFDWKNIL